MRHKWSLGARPTRPLRPGTPSGPPNSLFRRLDEVGGLWGAGQSLPEPASPALLPDSKAPRSHSSGRGMSGQIVSDGPHTPRTHTHQEKDPEPQGENTPTITLLLHCAVSPSRNCCYYAVNFQYPHGKTKTADGWCVMLRRIAVGGWWHVEPSAPPFLLDEAFKASDSFDTADANSNGNRLFGWRTKGDWPIRLSVLSRGIVFIISLDKTSFFIPTHQQPWERRSTHKIICFRYWMIAPLFVFRCYCCCQSC